MTEESGFNSEQENGAKISSCITFNMLKTCGSENNRALQTTEINRHVAGTNQDAGRTKGGMAPCILDRGTKWTWW